MGQQAASSSDQAVVELTTPRLLGVEATATYLGISTWSVRALVVNGHLKPVRLPDCHRRNPSSRRLLFDRRDVDAFVDARRHA
jgi:hypothetical protein